MTPNLKVILSAMGVAALAASPAMAKSHAHAHYVAPAAVVPADAHAYAGPSYAGPFGGRPLVTPYGADLRERAHEMPGPSPDFQLGGEK